MDSKFEEMFEEKFGSTFSTESMKFLNKALMYEGWLLHKEYLKQFKRDLKRDTINTEYLTTFYKEYYKQIMNE